MNAARLCRAAGMCLLLACSSTRAQAPVFAASDVLPLLKNREREWNKPRTPLALAAGKASDCASYARLRPSGILDDGDNQRIKSEYLVCDVLIQVGPVPNPTPLSANDGYGAALATRLDLRSFPSSLGPMVRGQRRTLSGLFGDQVRVESDGALVKTPEMFFSLTVAVVGDLDHDGVLDWLVWLSDEATDGTYRGYETLLIKDPASNGLLRAQSL